MDICAFGQTTSEKFMMKGQAINLSNLEKKFKDEFEEVANQIKNTDYLISKAEIKIKYSSFFQCCG